MGVFRLSILELRTDGFGVICCFAACFYTGRMQVFKDRMAVFKNTVQDQKFVN